MELPVSGGATFVETVVLRGWARGWDGLSQQLTSERGTLIWTLAELQLGFMDSATAALDNAAGELLRSGIYSTYVANAAETADGRALNIDHVTFAIAIYGTGGALTPGQERVYSEAINQPEHDPTIPGLDQTPAPGSVSTPAPTGGSGSPEPRGVPMPTLPVSPHAPAPAEPVFRTTTAIDAVRTPSVPVAGGQPTPEPELIALAEYPIDTAEGPVAPTAAGADEPERRVLADLPVLVDAAGNPATGEPVLHALDSLPVFGSTPVFAADTPTSQTPPLPSLNGFGEDGIAGPVLPSLVRDPGAPEDLHPLLAATDIDTVAAIANPGVAGTRGAGVGFGENGVAGSPLAGGSRADVRTAAAPLAAREIRQDAATDSTFATRIESD